MIGIILAAGKGTRLQPLTYAIPKPLLPVGGKPVIEYVIENLKNCKGITKIYIAVSHMRDALEHYFSQVDYGIPIELVRTLGWETAGDLKTVILEKNITEKILVAYGDNITRIDLTSLSETHAKSKRKATVALFEVPLEDVPRFGVAELDSKGAVLSFIEKPKHKVNTNKANAGYYLIEPEAFELIPLRKVKVEESLFKDLVKEKQLGAQVCALPFWLDIGTIESYRKANQLLEGFIPPELRK